MRNLIVMAVALAVASCGGTANTLSQSDAQSVANEITAALQSREASGTHDLTFGGSSTVVRQCAEHGSVTVAGSLAVNCPSGYYSCTTSGSLSVNAAECTTAAGVTINGTISATISGSGITFTETASGTLTVTLADGETSTCNVSVTSTGGKVSGTVCGVSL